MIELSCIKDKHLGYDDPDYTEMASDEVALEDVRVTVISFPNSVFPNDNFVTLDKGLTMLSDGMQNKVVGLMTSLPNGLQIEHAAVDPDEVADTKQFIIVPFHLKLKGIETRFYVELIYGKSILHWIANDLIHENDTPCAICEEESEFSVCMKLVQDCGLQICEILVEGLGNPLLKRDASLYESVPLTNEPLD